MQAGRPVPLKTFPIYLKFSPPGLRSHSHHRTHRNAAREIAGVEILLGFRMRVNATITTIIGLSWLMALALGRPGSVLADSNRAASQADSSIIENAPAPKPLDYGKLAQ